MSLDPAMEARLRKEECMRLYRKLDDVFGVLDRATERAKARMDAMTEVITDEQHRDFAALWHEHNALRKVQRRLRQRGLR